VQSTPAHNHSLERALMTYEAVHCNEFGTRADGDCHAEHKQPTCAVPAASLEASYARPAASLVAS
jgi:hypothetical protein